MSIDNFNLSVKSDLTTSTFSIAAYVVVWRLLFFFIELMLHLVSMAYGYLHVFVQGENSSVVRMIMATTSVITWPFKNLFGRNQGVHLLYISQAFLFSFAFGIYLQTELTACFIYLFRLLCSIVYLYIQTWFRFWNGNFHHLINIKVWHNMNKQDYRRMRLKYSTQTITSHSNKNGTQITSLVFMPAFDNYFSLAFLSWKLSLWFFWRIEKWVFSISPPNVSLIGP